MVFRVGPTWKMIIVYIAVIILFLFMAGCGVRKVNGESISTTTKDKDIQSTEQSSGSKTDEREIKKEDSSQEDKKDVVITETTKDFDSNGNITKETTRTTIDKSTSTSKSKKEEEKKTFKQKWLNIKSTTYKLQIITTKTKKKDVVSDKSFVTNFGGWVPLIIGLIIVVAAIFFYFRLKNKTI